MSNCVFFGDKIESKVNQHLCRVHEVCSPTNGKRVASCDTCEDKLLKTDPDFAKRWIDPLNIVTSNNIQTDCLRGILKGRSSFLVCSGPSAKPFLEKMNRRGVFSLAVNNAAGCIHRPNAFVHSDPPVKFSHSIWNDPGIMKFVPIPKLHNSRGMIREKVDGIFRRCGSTVESPNVWGFRRNSWMYLDDTFFTDEGAAWGNQDVGVKRTGESKTVCTMLLGMRLLYYLGSRRIYLVGVDFLMNPGNVYSFAQGKAEGGCSSNNHQFEVVNGWIVKMQEDGVFDRFGLQLFNCYKKSGLQAFPHVPFEYAIQDVCKGVEETPDLTGWYEKEDCPKCCSWSVKWSELECQCVECGFEWNSKDRPNFTKKERRKYKKERERVDKRKNRKSEVGT